MFTFQMCDVLLLRTAWFTLSGIHVFEKGEGGSGEVIADQMDSIIVYVAS